MTDSPPLTAEINDLLQAVGPSPSELGVLEPLSDQPPTLSSLAASLKLPLNCSGGSRPHIGPDGRPPAGQWAARDELSSPPELVWAGLSALLKSLELKPGRRPNVTAALVDTLVAQTEQTMATLLDAIVHHQAFSSLERIWRSLWFLIKSVNFEQNIIIEILNVSANDLLEDFEDSPEIGRAGLFRIAYISEYGQFGGQPYAAIIGAYELGHGPRDMKLLEYTSMVGATVHAPFLTNVGPAFFGLRTFQELDNVPDLKGVFEEARFTRFRSLRDNEDSRYLGLCLPGFLLRAPWSYRSGGLGDFDYEERQHDRSDFCWGLPAFALAGRLADSFANFRWCVNIIGEKGGGLVKGLESIDYASMGRTQARIPTECLIAEPTEYVLSKEGLISMVTRRQTMDACFFSANTPLKPKRYNAFDGGQEATLNHYLSTQLPYMMIVNRLAHYLKVLQRENIGSWRERTTVESELNRWINQYVTEMDNPTPAIRGRRPLRFAQVDVREVEGQPGWYKVNLTVRPHFKYMGATFSLSVSGPAEKME
ncbi:MAG: type VI secretion system contractile sheath large subunit [Deltaproteobacteria bacterium]|jgi:type VI secretion system protein ImpC|nr:type VI secretion system contractile sheath large subunit [Deltaproteobacteria bacterium]